MGTWQTFMVEETEAELRRRNIELMQVHNLGAARGRLPDADMRRRMEEFVDSL